MDSSRSNLFELWDICEDYCGIISRYEHASSNEALPPLSKLVESRQTIDRNLVFDDLSKLMAILDLDVHPSQFTMFYKFVFFICCENGQKRITVSRAIAAWRLVFKGRFRMLNQWCDFVEVCLSSNSRLDKWYLDSGYSRHMTFDPSNISTLNMEDQGTVTFGDNAKGKIIGEGTIKFKAIQSVGARNGDPLRRPQFSACT
ncbi:defective in cullin neddylation protein AAR3-like isoform X3 [Tasmannia lanceolata]|uniref:defective in cullin neddylation protein AAR3-like isoform X3 n=1 Tax=Tasmannia lanceolata TaxID=3420 RepID=UPI004063EA37